MGDLSLLAEQPRGRSAQERRHSNDPARDFELLPQRVLQFVADILFSFEEDTRVFAALAHPLAAKADTTCRFFRARPFNARSIRSPSREMPSP